MPVNALFSFLIKKRLQQIDLFRENPHEARSSRCSTTLVRVARYTEWGKRHEYGTIATPISSASGCPCSTMRM